MKRKRNRLYSAIGFSLVVVQMGCGGVTVSAPLGGSLFEWYLAISDDGAAQLIEYEVSQGFITSVVFTGIGTIEDAEVLSDEQTFVASAKSEATLLTAQYSVTNPVGSVQSFPVTGATSVGRIGIDQVMNNVFVVVNGTTLRLFHIEGDRSLTGETTVLSGLPEVRDLIVVHPAMYVVTDQTVFAYTLNGTGLPILVSSVFAPHGVIAFKLGFGESDETAYLLTGSNELRTFDIDFLGGLIPDDTVDLSFDLVKNAKDIAPFNDDVCLVGTVDGEVLAVSRVQSGTFEPSLSVFLGQASGLRSISVDHVQARLLVTSDTGVVRGYLLQTDGNIGAVSPDAQVDIGAPGRSSLLSIDFVP